MAFSFLDAAPSFIKAFNGISLINDAASVQIAGTQMEATAALQGSQFTADLALQGAKIESDFALQGADLQAQRYRMAGAASAAEAKYNISLDKYNTGIQKEAFGRQVSDLFSKNRSIQGASGLSFGSKSYLVATSQNMSAMERQFMQLKNAAYQRQATLAYQGQNAANSAENSARIAEYNGQTQSILASYKGQVDASKATYQGQVAAADANYRGQVAQYQADLQNSKNVNSLFSNVFSMFGG
jgi:hypothetical protein